MTWHNRRRAGSPHGSRPNQSSGRVGERLAEVWFQQHAWTMFRTQPESRIVTIKGVPTMVPAGTGGIADYTGYRIHPPTGNPVYCACEVKEERSDTLPHSRLSTDQRKWMEAIPTACGFVAVCWMSGNIEVEVFSYQPGRGAYCRGQGFDRGRF
jgi:hypothetical protein